jgi:hypothetical protein
LEKPNSLKLSFVEAVVERLHSPVDAVMTGVDVAAVFESGQ